LLLCNNFNDALIYFLLVLNFSNPVLLYIILLEEARKLSRFCKMARRSRQLDHAGLYTWSHFL